MSLQGSLSIERMCQMVPVSRRSFYRSLKEQQPVEEEMGKCDLRSNKLPWSIAAATAIDESPRSCTVEECR